jgi:PLP dependent protein
VSAGTADPVGGPGDPSSEAMVPRSRGTRELAGRIEAVRSGIDRAARRAGREPFDVLLIAAAKDVDAGMVAVAARFGITDVGENRAQELRSKQAALQDIPLRWHFIGVIQRNKAKDVVGRVVLVHSVDSLALASTVSRRATKEGTIQDVLLEVNVGGEPSKRGVALDDVSQAAERLATLEGVRLRGLMTIPPQTDEPEGSRVYFRALRESGAHLRRKIPEAGELSMGMSADFEVAIEEGATIVRVGTAIFGPRPLH